ncbi:MAG: hypothetical protein M0R17_06420 [Candidatus Omnitrophica bacterium]|jgi:hypothetical protein|nr:hypothetical protein [Candidatus Omnitrophota bacterium]
MKTPKILQKFVDKNNLIIIPIRYKCQGVRLKRYGFDVCKKETFISGGVGLMEIVFSLEPLCDNTQEKWYLKNVSEDYNNPRYWKRICNRMFKRIDLNKKSFYRGQEN